jgi:hypothetical protein
MDSHYENETIIKAITKKPALTLVILLHDFPPLLLRVGVGVALVSLLIEEAEDSMVVLVLVPLMLLAWARKAG